MATSPTVGIEETDRLPDYERTAGQDEEFSLLVYRQHRFVFRVVFALLRNAHDAEDVTQEVFLKLFRSGRWKGVRDERAFLARTAWRLALDLRRAPAMKIVDVDPDATESQGASPEEQLACADAAGAFHRLIDSLPEELRLPLVLSGIDGLTSREVGVVLGLAEGTVRTRLMRARQLLKDKISGSKGGALCGINSTLL
jgi:RNA polymerase sigma-70 factor, ECF subfamily